jgi:hypothetical protein
MDQGNQEIREGNGRESVRPEAAKAPRYVEHGRAGLLWEGRMTLSFYLLYIAIGLVIIYGWRS